MEGTICLFWRERRMRDHLQKHRWRRLGGYGEHRQKVELAFVTTVPPAASPSTEAATTRADKAMPASS